NRNSPNATFVQTDMSDFSRPERFDFFVFPDVLEHIPAEQHAALFRTVAAHAASGAKILINIPEPECLDWMRRHHPEKLQIIDQSLSLSKLIADVEAAGFHLRSVVPYRLFHDVDEYVSLVFSKR